jgi:hypothetical protein
MRHVIAVLVASFAAACGSSSGGSVTATDAGHDSGMGTGPTGDAGGACDAADAGRDCMLTMPVQGGLDGTLDGQVGCGTGSGTGGTINWDSSVLGGRVTATFMGAIPEQPGSYVLASLQIRAAESDGAVSSWTAPSGACSITVNSVDVECQGAFREYLHILYGTGSCSQPAAPDTGTTAAPITIGDFQFSHWLSQ